MAQDALKREDFRSALALLRAGLARAPDNRDGRLALANFYRMMKDEDNTVNLLMRGLDFHSNDPLYLKVCLQTLLMYRRDVELMDYANTRLANLPEKPDTADRMVAYVAAQLCEKRGNFVRAIALLNDYALTDTEEGSMLMAKTYWTCGKREQAITYLKQFMMRHPNFTLVGVHKTLCEYLHQMGRDNDAMTNALSVVNDDPKSYNARRDLIEAYHNLGRDERADLEIRRYLRDFPDKADALLLIGDYATNTPNASLANEIYYTAAEQGFNMGIFGLMMIESHLSAGDYAQAADYCQQLIDENPVWLPRYEGQINYLRAACARALGQDSMAELYLTRLLESNLDGNDLLAMGKRMHSLGMDDDALKLLERAQLLNPRNEESLALMVDINIQHNMDSDFVNKVDTLLNLRRPDFDLLRKARQRITSDHFIFDERRSDVMAKLDKALSEPSQLDNLL